MADIRLDDLSPDELEKLMEQARIRLEQERLLQDARAEYKQKKKLLLENSLKSVYNLATFDESTEKDLYKRFVGLVNFLYKGCTWGFKYTSKNFEISNRNQWEEYERIVSLVTDCLRNVINYGEV